MGYFHLLELQQEPFSNAPDPDFFYLSTPHRDCLQQIELGLRLRRGLSLVIGEVGAGKTTLCRHLYAAFSRDPGMQMVFVPDPAFRDVRAFLVHVAAGLGIGGLDREEDLREAICAFFLKEAEEKGRIVVILMDEAQKLSADIIEVMREFLNFETNREKLVQMVLVGQPELLLENRPPENFMDRVHLCHHLKPLGFRDTRALIRHRLRMAGREDAGLFSFSAVFAIHRRSGGHPRKIIHLCHHTLLLLLVRNRRRADWRLVMQAAGRLPAPLQDGRGGKSGVLFPLLLGLNLLLLLGLGGWMWRDMGKEAPLPVSGLSMAETPAPREGFALAAAEDGKGGADEGGAAFAVSSGEPVPVVLPQGPPRFLGRLAVRPGDMVTDMVWRIYGVANRETLARVREANPGLADLNRIRSGEYLRFPAVPVGFRPRYPAGILFESRDLASAWERLRNAEDRQALRLIPVWREDLGLRFRLIPNVCLDGDGLAVFSSPAGQAVSQEPWEEGLVFYADPERACAP